MQKLHYTMTVTEYSSFWLGWTHLLCEPKTLAWNTRVPLHWVFWGPCALCDQENRDFLCPCTGDWGLSPTRRGWKSFFLLLLNLYQARLRGPAVGWESRWLIKENSYFLPIKDRTNTVSHSSESTMPHLNFQRFMNSIPWTTGSEIHFILGLYLGLFSRIPPCENLEGCLLPP